MKIKKYKHLLLTVAGLLLFVIVDMYFIMKDFGIKQFGQAVVCGFRFNNRTYFLNYDLYGNYISFLTRKTGSLSFYYALKRAGDKQKIKIKIEPSNSNKSFEKSYDPIYKIGFVVIYPEDTYFITGYYPNGKIRYKCLVQNLGYNSECLWFYGYDKKGDINISTREKFYYSGLFCLDFSREIKGPYIWEKKFVEHPVMNIGMLKKKNNEK